MQVTSCWSNPQSGNLTEWENNEHWDMTWTSENLVWIVRKRSFDSGSVLSPWTISTLQWSLLSPVKFSNPYALNTVDQLSPLHSVKWNLYLTSLWYSTSVIGGLISCECNRLLESECLKVTISPSLTYSMSVGSSSPTFLILHQLLSSRWG